MIKATNIFLYLYSFQWNRFKKKKTLRGKLIAVAFKLNNNTRTMTLFDKVQVQIKCQLQMKRYGMVYQGYIDINLYIGDCYALWIF